MYQMSNNNGIVINGKERYVYKNGQKVDIPDYIKGNNITNIDGKVYVNGYKLKDDGTWKRSLIAMWHMLF